MVKKCIICDKEAELCIKDSSECYCTECAKEQFEDTSYLVNVEDETKKLKEAVDDNLDGE
ncbi:MAG: hypothetical protein WC471_05340 [Candidatus Woesearchaeota archaeon]